MVQDFTNWVVAYAHTDNLAVVGVFLVIAIALASTASFLKDRRIDAVARVAGAIAATLAAWAAWTQRWTLLSTVVTLLAYATVAAAAGIVILRAVRFARNREAARAAITHDDVAAAEATPADEVSDELALMVEQLRAENPAEFARIRAEVRRAA